MFPLFHPIQLNITDETEKKFDYKSRNEYSFAASNGQRAFGPAIRPNATPARFLIPPLRSDPLRTQIQILTLALLSPFAAVGCGEPVDADRFDVGALTQPEAFNAYTDPADLIDLISSGTLMNADGLVPTTSIGRTISVPTDSRPFSSPYWPMVDDGINYRWQGSTIPSPAEKYAQVFLDSSATGQMLSWITDNHGKKVPGVQSWFGICQGWTASAINEKAPKHAAVVRKVTRPDGTVGVQACASPTDSGCVRFEPGDVTALLAEAYAAADSRFIGYRCDTSPASFKYDASGRIQMPNCRSNAGTLFLTATNFIGRAHRAFAVNAVNNDEIWNQPAFAYRISTYQKVTALQAAQLVNSSQTSYTYNTAAKDFRHVVMTLTWTVEADPTVGSAPPVRTASGTYDMVVELDSLGNVIGGEWVGSSKTNHPPFFWAPVAPGLEVPYMRYDQIKAILDLSRS